MALDRSWHGLECRSIRRRRATRHKIHYCSKQKKSGTTFCELIARTDYSLLAGHLPPSYLLDKICTLIAQSLRSRITSSSLAYILITPVVAAPDAFVNTITSISNPTLHRNPLLKTTPPHFSARFKDSIAKCSCSGILQWHLFYCTQIISNKSQHTIVVPV